MFTKVAILNVFTNENGDFGNPVGIIVDLEKQLSYEEMKLSIILNTILK